MPPPNGYAWWYVDATSADGAHALTIIAFVGSVFSPYYAWARRRGDENPNDHCAFNVALYSRGRNRWSMTERGEKRLHSEADLLAIGASEMRWTGQSLEIAIDETCAPIPRRIRGTVRLTPLNLCEDSYDLDAAGQHRWRPYAVCAHIEVSLSEPQLNWTGSGYWDSNAGSQPLETAFTHWHWSRSVESQRCLILYDVEARDASHRSLALNVNANGDTEPFDAPAMTALPATRWRVARATRNDAEHSPSVVRTLEDAPFYSRSLLKTRARGLDMTTVHESLDLNRFRSRWVQCLLPFRMPRVR